MDPGDPATLYDGEEYDEVSAPVLRTSDGGSTWEPIDTGLSSDNVYALTITASGVPYAGTDVGVFAFIE